MTERRYPDRPLVGVGAALFTPALDRVLLVKRGAPPAQGLWSVPGGLARVGEPLLEACRREVLEETGLEPSSPLEIAKVVERIIPDASGRVEYHFVIVDFWGLAPDLEPTAASDAAEVRWVPIEGLDELHTTLGISEGVRRALALARGDSPSTPLFHSSNAVS
jgi:8-oxo-dGTP diphosphatase